MGIHSNVDVGKRCAGAHPVPWLHAQDNAGAVVDRRVNVRTVIIPKDNVKDLADMPAAVTEGLDIIPVSTLLEAVPHIFRDASDALKREAAASARRTKARATARKAPSPAVNGVHSKRKGTRK